MGDNAPVDRASGTLLPPTRSHIPPAAAAAPGTVPLRPFVAGRPRAVAEAPIWVPPADDPAVNGPVPPPPEVDEPAPIGFGGATFVDAPEWAADTPAEAAEDFGRPDTEGAAGVEAEAAANAGAETDVLPFEPRYAPEDSDDGPDGAEPFPLDAFIVPPGRVVTRADDEAARRELDFLADRLDEIAAELREHGSSALQNRLHHGDRLDTVVAAVLAGYLAGLDGH